MEKERHTHAISILYEPIRPARIVMPVHFHSKMDFLYVQTPKS